MAKRICTVEGCDRPHEAHGLCQRHYKRLRKHGTTDVVPRSHDMTDASRVELYVDQSAGPDACWPWTAYISEQGYGWTARDEGPQGAAHRLAYEVLVGPIPDGLTLDHICHDPDVCPERGPSCPHRRCCNPCHLRPTSNAANMLRGSSPSALNARRTTCPEGHPYDMIRKCGRRRCTQCEYARRRARAQVVGWRPKKSA